MRSRTEQRPPARDKQTLIQPGDPTQVGSAGSMPDSTADGRRHRTLQGTGDHNRQVLHLATDTSLPARRVIRVLGQLKETRGLPNMIRVDNGPEFISQKLDQWCKEHQITLAFIQPGKPTQNAYIERLNGSM